MSALFILLSTTCIVLEYSKSVLDTMPLTFIASVVSYDKTDAILPTSS